jgi:CDP-glycerol glycerophosphotransferase (TagB/SpsB family)
MQRYIAAGLVTPERAALVGFPKLDALVNARVSTHAKATALGLDGSVPTAIYAPTFSPASSLQLHGEEIVRRLLHKGLNVIVKLHDRSLDPDPAYSGGVDWRARFTAFEGPRFLFASSGDSTDYLLASDVMVTDHSTIGFEFCALERPLVVFDMPGLLVAARVDPHKAQLLKSAADVVATITDFDETIERALRDPGRRAVERREAVDEVFYDPGRATARALDLCYGLIDGAVSAAHSAVSAWPERP